MRGEVLTCRLVHRTGRRRPTSLTWRRLTWRRSWATTTTRADRKSTARKSTVLDAVRAVAASFKIKNLLTFDCRFKRSQAERCTWRKR